MLTIHIILVVLFVLAIVSLSVGVSNDAVNFLNPAIGSKASNMKILFVLVSLGVLVGAVFSSGMMEVARKGIFNPENFYFSEVMFIFLSVMLTNIILLDAYNTLGLPTSTTVSLVFALLGGSVCMALIKMNTQEGALSLTHYINTSKALAIISGILFSIIIAFFFGTLIQWLTRLLFSFNYEKRMKYFGAIFGGLAITVIVYFMLIKGMKGASFMTAEMIGYIEAHATIILLICFLSSCILLEILYLLFKVSILKIVVLLGTMSLAMAFAGNDLVNFIGVPMAGLASYNIFMSSGAADINSFTMEALSGPVKADVYLLVIAGVIMVLSLWFSKKARTVIKTSIDLSRQSEGQERFGTSMLAKQVVRFAVNTSHTMNSILPEPLKRRMARQFEPKVYSPADTAERPAFDLLRASVSLVVASILIALGTSLKLPLSTTYVSFMVAMATSFADKAWGRESAVYRITGVLSVIGGWFITAFVSFILAAILLVVIYYGGLIAIIVLLLLTAFFFVRSNLLHKKRESEQKETVIVVSNSFLEETKQKITEFTSSIFEIYKDGTDGICEFKMKKLKKRLKRAVEIDKETKIYKKNIYATLSITGTSFENSGVYYVQMIDYLSEAADCLTHVVEPAFEHVSNNHKELTSAQIEGLMRIQRPIEFYFSEYQAIIRQNNFSEYDNLSGMYDNICGIIETVRSEQIKRIRSKQDPTRSSLLVIDILQETENLLGDMQKMLKAYIRFRMSF